jgi:hypothetical protein
MSYTYHTNLPGGLSPTKGWVKGVEKSETPGMMLGANGRVLRELPGWMEANWRKTGWAIISIRRGPVHLTSLNLP